MNDQQLWDKVTKTVTPLGEPKPPTHRPKKHQEIKLYSIDLHGHSFQDAYDIVCDFVSFHYETNSKKIIIITGKGKNENSMNREIVFWLEQFDFIRHTEWTNDFGAIVVYF